MLTKQHFKDFADLVLLLEDLEQRGERITAKLVEDELIKICEAYSWRFDWAKWQDYKEKKRNKRV